MYRQWGTFLFVLVGTSEPSSSHGSLNNEILSSLWGTFSTQLKQYLGCLGAIHSIFHWLVKFQEAAWFSNQLVLTRHCGYLVATANCFRCDNFIDSNFVIRLLLHLPIILIGKGSKPPPSICYWSTAELFG